LKPRIFHHGLLLAALALNVCAQAGTSPNSETPTNRKESSSMTQHATGTFDVKLLPLAADVHDGKSPIGRMSNDKVLHGDVEGTSQGQMLMLGTPVQGSAAYVSIEVISGTLHGRSGTFALQHNGIMTRGVGQLAVTVVPDSGTGELTGLSGTFNIRIEKGVHYYDLDYTLPQ
jgi:Protein of unknown function (DUF3224)